MLYPCSGITLHNKNALNADTWFKMAKSWKKIMEETNHKEQHTMYYCIYMKFPEWEKFKEKLD